MILKILDLNYPVTRIFFYIFKFNKFLFFFFILFFLFFFLFVFIFIFYGFYLKNCKYIFLKCFFLEFFWIFFPFYLISFLFFYSIFLTLKIQKNSISYLNIKIISYQWKWYFIYLNDFFNINLNYFSTISNCIFSIFNYNYNFSYQYVDNKLVLPLSKTIRFIFFSNDVIHSLYIPSIGLKQDSIPGFLKNYYFKSIKLGKYIGYCSELCGKNHSYMPFVLKIISNKNFKKWKKSFIFIKFLIFNF